MTITADSIVLTVRDLVPDPSSTPSTDGGLFAAASLYRWINEAVKIIVPRIGWEIIDWFPVAVVSNQANYSIDSKWHVVTDAFKDRFMLTAVDESAILWPMASTATRSMWWGQHRVTDHIEVTPFPTPSASDPVTSAVNSIAPTDITLQVGSTAGFMSPGGFVQIDNEIIYYNGLTISTLTGCIRGQAGTTANSHSMGATIQHMSLWVKGKRSPIEITGASSVIELQPIYVQPLQKYVLAQCRRAEQDHQEARALMQEFEADLKEILNDPGRIEGNGAQIQEYLGEWANQLVFGRIILG